MFLKNKPGSGIIENTIHHGSETVVKTGGRQSTAFGLHIATNHLTLLPKVSLCCDVQTCTHELRRVVRLKHSFNYAVKFSPRCPSYSGEWGHGGVFGDRRRSLKWVKEDGKRPWWHQGKTTSVLSGGKSNSGPCFLLLSVPSPTHEKKTRQHLRTASCLSGNIMIRYINK